MDVAERGTGVIVDLSELVSSWYEAISSGETERGEFCICVQRERNRCVYLVLASLFCFEGLKMEQMASE